MVLQVGRGARRRQAQYPSAEASSIRVSTAIQFTSQVLPPSAENACSKRQDVGVISEMTKRTKICRPFSVSWP
ncbi:MAG: hypothetical protein H0W36_03435 [Gemmatimonadetes bacterium]|nr:hypothetical protein [Gemmatimonadota bacterium]